MLSRPNSGITFYCHATSTATGYGRHAVDCVEALNANRIVPARGEVVDVSLLNPGDPTRSRVRFTMWESDELPPSFNGFMASDALIVPCRHNLEVFRRAGYSKRIEVVPLYGDAAFGMMPSDTTLKYLCVAKDSGVDSRKGIDELLQWFSLAFPTEQDVSLTVKQSPDCRPRYTFDKRITIINEDFNRFEYEALLREHHVGVFLSGMEAWNFPAAELMATGRPSILVPHGGPVDFATRKTSWFLPYTLGPAPDGAPYFGSGMVARPTKAGFIKAMREAYTNRALIVKKAVASHDRSKQFTKAAFMKNFKAVVLDMLGKA